MPQLPPVPAAGAPLGPVPVSRAVEDVLAAADLDAWAAWDALWLPRRPFAAHAPPRGEYPLSVRRASPGALPEATRAGLVTQVAIAAHGPDPAPP
ncbi:hypothetical protein, partial [Microbacterium sp. HSID17254]|uniref:hypothetical protein n=1 Tax=Microbacterium sp. HSID17254 TaxID=2419509 RepID=UPI001EE90A0D